MNWRLQTVLEAVKGSVVCEVEGIRTEYTSGAEAMEALKGKYAVDSIEANRGKLLVHVVEDTTILNDQNADWVKEHIKRYGVEPNAFGD